MSWCVAGTAWRVGRIAPCLRRDLSKSRTTCESLMGAPTRRWADFNTLWERALPADHVGGGGRGWGGRHRDERRRRDAIFWYPRTSSTTDAAKEQCKRPELAGRWFAVLADQQRPVHNPTPILIGRVFTTPKP
ncbi:hypothetical protein DIPPA_01445 [Diplonema papillatum]|nr:hypothetical protein DIPPA_01445 [Diplonema papillatum]